jgi:hypothetical protein
MSHGPTPESTFRFNAADLAANKEGHMGRHQMRGIYVFAFFWIISGALFLLAMAVAIKAQNDREGHAWYDLLFPVLFAIPVCGVCFLLGFGRLRAVTKHSPVTCYTGTVKAADRKNYWLVGEKGFRGPSSGGAFSGSNPAYKLLAGGPTCNVYLVNNREAVSIEILSAGG